MPVAVMRPSFLELCGREIHAIIDNVVKMEYSLRLLHGAHRQGVTIGMHITLTSVKPDIIYEIMQQIQNTFHISFTRIGMRLLASFSRSRMRVWSVC